MSKITLELTEKQARLVGVAIIQEMKKGSSTFLSGRDVVSLNRALTQIKAQFKETV